MIRLTVVKDRAITKIARGLDKAFDEIRLAIDNCFGKAFHFFQLRTALQ